ncbi:hypothetical protein B0H13DRAFT_2421325 [Mycena leptocephala]|nr:hypothetical protein B0H13DRAFT_2421325 [Mycena leptocephala]
MHHPEGRANPAPAHFAKNTPVEMHPPVSPRLLQQRHLDREGRAICRIVYAHGIGIQIIANVFCVSEDTVIQAIENKPTNKDHDKAENDYWYVSDEYRNQYPSLSKPGYHRTVNDRQEKAQDARPTLSPSKSSSPKKAQPSGCEKDHGGTDRSSSAEAAVFLRNPTARHFKDNRAVNGSDGKLDRKGRAICRIMYPYIGSYTKIATIFGTGHTRVRRGVLNDYSPKDNVTEDYDCAGKDFKDEYPPLSKKREHDSGKASWTYISARCELPLALKLIQGAVGIRAFLKNVGGFDLSQWQETFKEKGLTLWEISLRSRVWRSLGF